MNPSIKILINIGHFKALYLPVIFEELISRILLLNELLTVGLCYQDRFFQLTTHVPGGTIPSIWEIDGNPGSLDDVDTAGPILAGVDEWAGQDGYRDEALGPGLDRLLDQNLVTLNLIDYW